MAFENDPFAEFAEAAASYIDLVEHPTSIGVRQLPGALALALTTLYRAGARLPGIALPESADPNSLPGDRKAAAGYWEAAARLQLVLDDAAFGWETWSWDLIPPYVEYERSEIISELSNDLAEIYEDVRNYLAGLSRPEHAAEARWEVRFGFWGHTGDHIVNALRLLHPEAGAGGHGPPEQEGTS